MATEVAETRAVGRPTKYDPAYCDQVIEFMRKGFSLTAFGGHILVARSTLNEWMNNFPEFSEAVKVAQATRTNYLEGGLLSSEAAGPQITARIFALKNAAPEEWREKQLLEHTGADGGPVQSELSIKFV
jgi:transposase